MADARLGQYPVYSDPVVPVGKVLGSELGIHMHPLDVLVLTHPVATERLPLAMAWLLNDALRRLDRLVRSLRPESHDSETAGDAS